MQATWARVARDLRAYYVHPGRTASPLPENKEKTLACDFCATSQVDTRCWQANVRLTGTYLFACPAPMLQTGGDWKRREHGCHTISFLARFLCNDCWKGTCTMLRAHTYLDYLYIDPDAFRSETATGVPASLLSEMEKWTLADKPEGSSH